jgi:L-threonylcarbamoyladenylate synthase
MIVAKCTDEGISRCAEILKQGGVAVFPTDTVYGVGCDPYNASAVDRIFEIKHRDEKKALPVLVGSISDAEALVDLGRDGRRLAGSYWPGPVTIVAPLREHTLSPRITPGTNKLGVRVPAGKCVLGLLQRCRFLVGTSANLSGDSSPKTADEVIESGLDGVDILLDGGRVDVGRESTIIDILSRKVIREGAISADAILRVLAARGH